MRVVGPFLLGLLLVGCTSLEVKKLDAKNPGGVPFYLTKPVKRELTITYDFFLIATGAPIGTSTVKQVDIINMIDRDAAYTINHRRSFAGESKLKLERSTGADISKIEVENKEGVTELLKGLFQGAKDIAETAASLASGAAKPAGAIDQHEATYFGTLATKGIGVRKSVTSVVLTDL